MIKLETIVITIVIAIIINFIIKYCIKIHFKKINIRMEHFENDLIELQTIKYCEACGKTLKSNYKNIIKDEKIFEKNEKIYCEVCYLRGC